MKSVLTFALAIFIFANNAIAQTQSTSDEVISSTELSAEQERVQRLEELANAIKEESAALESLKKQLAKQSDDPELQEKVQQKAQNLEVVKKSFEQIAIKGLNLDAFKREETPQNWQEELTLVVKPLLENLRGLTEKPRRREDLKQSIALQKSAAQTASLAISSIDSLLSEESIESSTEKQLKIVKEKWQRQLTEAERKQELAVIELSNLNGSDASWFEAFKESLNKFARERGLTLFVAIIVAISVVFFFRGLMRLIDYRRSKKKRAVNRTSYRVIAYAQRLLTIIFVVIGIMIVFFVRGDVLLLALMSILLFASALGLKNFIPQFLEESRILLNIGRVREHELVMVNGIPWRVASINVFSKLINPEIRGVLRLPLEEMKSLVSRQIGDEKWFPSSIGDWVLDDSDNLYEVISQSPDAVELQSAQGTNKLVPSSDYYAAGLVNLTKSKEIRIVSVFGVDYGLQSISLDYVPEKLQETIQAYLEGADLGTQDIRVRVEFKEAAESSLNYLVIVNINSVASCHYYRIERLIQQACVKACNEEKWTIPFPQLTISNAT